MQKETLIINFFSTQKFTKSHQAYFPKTQRRPCRIGLRWCFFPSTAACALQYDWATLRPNLTFLLSNLWLKTGGSEMESRLFRYFHFVKNLDISSETYYLPKNHANNTDSIMNSKVCLDHFCK